MPARRPHAKVHVAARSTVDLAVLPVHDVVDPVPRVLPLRNNLESDKFHKFYTEPLELVVNCTAVPVCLENLQQGSSVLKNNYE
jgi:hypothetical protein